MRTNVRTLLDMQNPLNRLGPVTADALAKAGVSESRAALESGISRETLRRHLRPGGLTARKLGSLAHILGIRPDDLVARASKDEQ